MKGTKGKVGWLYGLIVLCLVASGFGAARMWERIGRYRETQDEYQGLQREALYQPETEAAASGTAAQPHSADTAAAEPVMAPEGEDVEDDAFLWMLHQSERNRFLLSAMDSSPTGGVTTPPAGEETAGAPGREASSPVPSAGPTPSPGPTATPAYAPAETAAGSKATPAITPVATPTFTPTLPPTPTRTPEPTPSPTPAYLPAGGINMERAVAWSGVKYAVDFDYLSRVNDNITGWLYQDGTEINYPIVRGDNNTFYLNHLFDGSANANGCIFMDCGNSMAFIDSGTYVYGHNTKDGSMFASLNQYREQSYYDAHPQMVLMTPFSDYQVDLFACMQTVVEDESSWRVKEFASEKDFNAFIDILRKGSLFAAPAESLPQWGDRLLVLVTCTNIRHGQRFVVFGRMRPIAYQNTDTIVTSKIEMDSRETQNGRVDIPGVGSFMLYAQDDPLWAGLRFEARGSGKKRKFGEGGCGPTAVAIALANLVDKEDLPKLIGYSNSELGYTFCSCSVNQYYCNHRHAQYQLRTGDEFLRYLPLAVANFATGNNIWEIRSRGSGQGTNMRYLENLCNLYNIGVFGTYEAQEAIDLLKRNPGKCMVISCAFGGSPFTTKGHYVVMAGVDDEYAYYLDPLRNNNYKSYPRDWIMEVVAPGVTRVKLENAGKINLSPYYVLIQYD